MRQIIAVFASVSNAPFQPVVSYTVLLAPRVSRQQEHGAPGAVVAPIHTYLWDVRLSPPESQRTFPKRARITAERIPVDVFLSWSQARSEAIAKALKDWLRLVLQTVNPWLSRDIEKGSRWDDVISEKLDTCNFGIICLTPENLNSPWLIFEAGALSKKLREARVCTYLLDLHESDISGPLAKFQHTRAEKHDTLALVETLNSFIDGFQLDSDRLRHTFELWWPTLAGQIDGARAIKPQQKADERTVDDKIDEVLLEIRSIERNIRDASYQPRLYEILSGRNLPLRRSNYLEFRPAEPAPRRIGLPPTSIDLRRYRCRTHHLQPEIQELGPQGLTVQACCDQFADELRLIVDTANEQS